MTFRAVFLGICSAMLLCGITYFNDWVMRQTFLIGNHLPIAVFGTLILVVLLLNPLLALLKTRWAFTGPELAVGLMLTLAVCAIPGSGLIRGFTGSLIMPYFHARTTPTWQQHKLLERVPPHMLAHVTPENEGDTLDGFVRGKAKGNRHMAFGQIPWYAWRQTLLFWLPLIVVLWIGLLGLSLVVHRQWADYEQLPYPIATFANALLPQGKQLLTEVARNRMFWVALVTVLLIHLNNYACQWFPTTMIPISLKFSLFPWQQYLYFPIMLRGGGASWAIMLPSIMFTVVAVSYFLPTDISLALGIGPTLWYCLVGTLAGYGITLGSGDPSAFSVITLGAYVGMLLVLLYTGRRFYSDVLRAAFFRPPAQPPNSQAVWGTRIFLLAMAVVIAYMSILGKLDWQIAFIYVGGIVLIHVVISRIVAETGVFFLSPWFTPQSIVLGLFGVAALGSQPMLIMLMLSMVLINDTREAFMPYVITGFRILDLQKVQVGKVAGFAVLAILLGLAVAIPVTLYLQYDRGAIMSDDWAVKSLSTVPFNSTVGIEDKLSAQGRLETANAIRGWGHFTHMRPDPKVILVFVIGVGLVLLTTVGRLRFARWPIHPVLFLMWTAWPSTWFAASILIGWLIKVLVTKYGGGKIYQQLKPLMFGLIAGEMAAAVVIVIIGAVYYLQTGELPKSFSIMIG